MKTADSPMAFVIPLHIFPFDVFVSIGQTDEQFKQRIRKYTFSELKDEMEDFLNLPVQCRGITNTLSNGATIIRIIYQPKSPTYLGTITHEVFHAVDGIMERVGIKLSDTSCEVYAYLMEYLTTQIFKQIEA